MRKLLYNVNGLTFSTMREAKMVAIAAKARAIPNLIEVSQIERQSPERYAAIREYFKQKRGASA